MDLKTISRRLCRETASLRFSAPVEYVYNPLDYAAAVFEDYVDKYGRTPRKYIILGMNPGPWGMAQTGVPFGEVSCVRDWLKITGEIGKPAREHPRRPIDGFTCHRSEVSGSRLWGWIRKRFKTPGRFFRHFFVANYCPLMFIEKSGRNRTPDKLPAHEKTTLFRACDNALEKTVRALSAQTVIAVGVFATKRAKAALAEHDVEVLTILHPSPANPAANRGWAEAVESRFKEFGVELSRLT